MHASTLREKQTPFKNQFKADPGSAMLTLRAVGELGADVTCRLAFSVPPQNAGLHPQAGGDGQSACSAEMLLHALVGCAGVTLGAVATLVPMDAL